ncbi:hypothetical protein RKLH11_530 [Rhodobacteraceae bacterium KLH11]|nr:hypothetical protein RKLH11_530 [Rhodobacteraceae bacterium KLH11]
MTIYPERPEPFTCAICLKHCEQDRWKYAPTYDRPPVCWRCEQDFGTGQYGDLNPDRRTIKQISALAEVLRCDAYRISIGEGPLYG